MTGFRIKNREKKVKLIYTSVFLFLLVFLCHNIFASDETLEGLLEKLGRIVGHGGGFFGINSNLDMYLDTGYTTAVMSNVGEGAQVVSGEIKKVIQSLVNRAGSKIFQKDLELTTKRLIRQY